MKASIRNQQIICAYALLFTVAVGVVALDPVKPAAEPILADVPVPQFQLEESSAAVVTEVRLGKSLAAANASTVDLLPK